MKVLDGRLDKKKTKLQGIVAKKVLEVLLHCLHLWMHQHGHSEGLLVSLKYLSVTIAIFS